MSNPFNITFGELPKSAITRENDINAIKKVFLDESPETKVYIISGPRGSGKTVLLTKLKKDFENEGFLSVDLNPFINLEEQFAAKLYEEGKLYKLFLQSEFSFSFQGITFSLKGKTPINNITTLIERMLSYLKKKEKRVLITIDDVSSTNEMRSFIYAFQQMIRENYPVYLLMSGLYENVSELERNKSLTFFLRAPKLILKPLNLMSIAYSYRELLNLDDKKAAEYAKLTSGYAYGYQLLGSLLYKNGVDSNVLDEYDLKLSENCYSLIWENLTNKEKSILKGISETGNIKELLKILNMENGYLQTYKKRLIDKGIITIKGRGEVSFALPRFKEFVKMQILLED